MRPPSPEAQLGARFGDFIKHYGLTELSPEELARIWKALEPRLRGAIIDEVSAAAEIDLGLSALAGGISSSGAVTLAVIARDSASGHFMVPLLTIPKAIDGPDISPSHTLSDFHAHGVAILVNLPNQDAESDSLHIGLDYLLTPTALQLDNDRFLARSGASVIGSCVLSAVISRRQRLPAIDSVARWRPTDSDEVAYRVHERDGTRHFIKVCPSDAASPSGISSIETVPPTHVHIHLPRNERHSGKVGLFFDEFHRKRGFATINPDEITATYPNLSEVIVQHLRDTFPGFRPEWRLELSRAGRRDRATAVLLNLSDATLDSFVPGLTAESSVRDRAFSGLLMTLEVATPEKAKEAPRGVLGWLGEKFPAMRPQSRSVMHLNIVGPVLSEGAWQTHLELLSSTPAQSLFFPPLARAIANDVSRHHAESQDVVVGSIRPTRVSPDPSEGWDTVVLAVDHSCGTHIVELVRERSFGLIPSLTPEVQQYFPRNHRQRKN